MKIGFWSPYHGTGATANMLALAVAMAEQMGRRILVTQTHYTMNNLEKPLLGTIENDEQFYRDTGLDAIMRYFKSGQLTEEQIDNCSIRINDNIFLLAGTKMSQKESYENKIVQDMVTHVIDIVQKYYDICFIDTNAGTNDQTTAVIRECDLVVVTVRQNRDMIDSVIANEMLSGKKVFYLFGSYDDSSKYNLANLRKAYGKVMNRRNSGGIPHSTEYMDAICDNRILRFITTNLDADEDSANFGFFEMLKEAAAGILTLAETKQ